MPASFFKLLVIFTTLIFLSSQVWTINHFKLRDNNILPAYDSPFYMREPDNLIAFLKQVDCNDRIEANYLQLMQQREQIVEQLRFSVQYGEELVDQAKCAMDYYLIEKRMSYLKLTLGSFRRFELPPEELQQFKSKQHADEPICTQIVDLKQQLQQDAFANLESFQNIQHLFVEVEEITQPGSFTAIELRQMAVEGLRSHAASWQYHTIASYYWRTQGNAQQAIKCGRIALMLTPSEYKDMPLLSMAVVLFRMNRLSDAETLLNAAVEIAPDVADNSLTLASVLAMKHEFNRSLHFFDRAESLDASLLPRTQPVRNFITCLENLTKKTEKMYSYVEFMQKEVKEFKKLKGQIDKIHEELLEQQIPLSARHMDEKTNAEFLKRSQYCSTRTSSKANEPVLFCDFFSDMQMRLESNDIDIEKMEKDLRMKSEAVIKLISAELKKQFKFQETAAAAKVQQDKLLSSEKSKVER